MANNQYEKYVKYLQEGDANRMNARRITKGAMAGRIPTNTNTTNRKLNALLARTKNGNTVTVKPKPQFKAIINAAATSPAAASKCLSAMKESGLNSWTALSNFFTSMFKGASGVFAKAWSGIRAALAWVGKILKPLGNYVARYGDLFMEFICGAVATVFFKLYEIFIGAQGKFGAAASARANNAPAPANTNNAPAPAPAAPTPAPNPAPAAESISNDEVLYHVYLDESIDRAIIEIQNLFNRLTILTESMNLTEGPGLYNMMNNYIQKVYPKVVEMWKWVSTNAAANPMLVTGISICAAFIFSWMGLKKVANRRQQVPNQAQQPAQNKQVPNQAQPQQG